MDRDKPTWVIWGNMYSGLYDANDSWVAYCPKCGSDFEYMDYEDINYCAICGQRVVFFDYQEEYELEKQRALDKSLQSFREWIETTSVFTKFDSYYHEIQALIVETVENCFSGETDLENETQDQPSIDVNGHGE